MYFAILLVISPVILHHLREKHLIRGSLPAQRRGEEPAHQWIDFNLKQDPGLNKFEHVLGYEFHEYI